MICIKYRYRPQVLCVYFRYAPEAHSALTHWPKYQACVRSTLGISMLSLIIAGFEGSPDRVTEILDIQPTFSSVAGDISSRSGKPFRKTSWQFTIHDDIGSGGDHSRAIDQLLAMLGGRTQRFHRLRDELSPQSIEIYGGLHFAGGEQAGVRLDATQMRVLADCGIGWGIDLFADTHDSNRA